MKSNKELYKDAFSEIKASQDLKEALMKKASSNNSQNRKKLSKTTAVLVAAAIIAVSGVSVYAAVQLYNMRTVQNGKYAQTLVLEKENSTTATANKQKYLKLSFSYMPKGYVKDSNTGKTYYSFNNRCVGGISALLYDVSKQEKITDKCTNVIDSGLTTIGGHQALYIQEEPQKEYDKNNPIMDKSVYIYLEDYDYILYIYGGSDLSKEELIKIAESAVIEECSESESAVILEWEDNTNTTAESENGGESIQTIFSKDKNTFINIGDTTALTTDNFDGVEVKPNVTVNSIDVADNLDMINDKSFTEKYLDKNGKLKPLEVRYYKTGDGVNSLTSAEEPIKTESYNLKFIYETVTYKNNTDNDMNDINVYHSIYNLKDGVYEVGTLDKLLSEGYNIGYDINNNYKLTEWVYDDFSKENTNNPNYISVPAHSEKTVHIGFFVLADDMTGEDYISIKEGSISTGYDFSGKAYQESPEDYVMCKID